MKIKPEGTKFIEIQRMNVTPTAAAWGSLFTSSACVLMGDLNSNVIWDHTHPAGLNHSALMTLMGSLGLISAYHGFHKEEQGRETRPTLYYRWNESTAFHIDYCFLPVAWSKRVTSVEVGGYEEWNGLSDHRPLLVDVEFRGRLRKSVSPGRLAQKVLRA